MKAGIRPLIRAVPAVATAVLLAIMVVPARAENAPVPPAGSVRLRVNCAAGQRVAGALAAAALLPLPVVVTITGVCPERVLLERDDVILQGAAPGAGLTSPATGEGTLLVLEAARRVTLYQLTLTVAPGSHDTALEILPGSHAHAGNLLVEAAGGGGIVLWDTATADVFDSEIRGTSAPIPQVQVSGGHMELSRSTVENGHGAGVAVVRNGSVISDGITIRGNVTGLALSQGSVASLLDADVSANQVGVAVSENASVLLSGTSRVADSDRDGVIASSGAVLALGGAVIENNQTGVNASGGSHVQNVGTIRNNRGSGVSLGDTSTLVGNPSASITGNAQWGIFCAPPPAVPQVTVGFPAANLTGNGTGATNCPTLGIVDRVP